MPRLFSFYSDFFYDPLTEDVEELLARLQHTDSVRYEDFSAIWRDMGLSDVFVGVTRMSEQKRFCRITLSTAVKYFLPPYSFQIRVGGLYLMYAFYHTQLAVPPVQIRLALKDYAQVQKFLQDAVDSGHQDVVYVYKKLVSIKAIHYVAMPHFLTFQKQKKPKKELVCAEFLGRATAVQDLYSADVLEEMGNIQSNYEKLKEATAKVNGNVTTMTNRDLDQRLKECMMEFMTWQQKTFSKDAKDKDSGHDDDEEKTAEAESSSRARLLSSIKKKSYSTSQGASKSRRHRQVEPVDSSNSSGPESMQHEARGMGHKKKILPLSLRARTRNSLGVNQEDSKLQAWLLSAPLEEEGVPVKRIQQLAPFRP